ncbi:hypothetical protein A2708_01465 [Candidatus Saccharibacteria bacterium RIFCSPHIGHO2_01_FULL_49_21]|nr:MAG: hypothetical protein A2708_01465 [Candidatus Saccharibacteria bacterium RIFCSPHIGHO2_01_FULL_49_21]
MGKYLFKRLALALVVLAALLFTAPALAQQDTSTSGISITPLLAEYTIKPGQADKLDITLKNVTSGDIIAQPFVEDFEADDRTGNPVIITDPNNRSPNSIKNFVSGLEDVPLAKGEQKTVTLAVQTPSNSPPGGYYGVIRYKAVPPNAPALEGGDVALSASVGTIVLITVPGTLTEQVELAGLHVYENDKEAIFFLKQPNKAGVEIKNLGNGFIKPFGTVEIRNMFGEVVYTYQLNDSNPRANILPDSSRIFVNDIKNISKPGRYTMTASVTYGTGGEILVGKKTFWYLPPWLVAIIVVVLLALIIAVVWAWRRLRHSSRHAHRGRR